MPAIFADSFGGLQAGENAQDSLRRQSLANAMNAAMSGIQYLGNRRLQQSQLDAIAKQRDEDLGLKKQEIEMAKRKAANEDWRDTERSNLARGYLDLAKDQLAFQKTTGSSVGNREHELVWNHAVQSADAGDFDSPDHVAQLYPQLSGTESQVIAQRSQSARKNSEALYAIATHAAGVLNKHASLSQGAADAKKGIASAGWFTGTGDLVAKQKALEEEAAKLAPAKNAITGDKRLTELITFDPDTMQYVPAIPTPRWNQASTGPEAPAGWQPTTGGQWMKPMPAASPRPNSDPAGEMAPESRRVNFTPLPPVATATTSGYSPKYSPWVYQRINELVGQGANLLDAKQQALAEDAR